MIFLNLALAFGAIAAAVPIIIHLLHRTKVRIVPWAAMQFLAGAIEKRSRRFQWQQWLLLAIRCAIPVFLALAMAQPAIDWFGRKLGNNTSGPVTVVLDNSYSVLANNISTENQIGSGINLQEQSNRIANTLVSQIAAPTLYVGASLDRAKSTDSVNISLGDRIATRFSESSGDMLDQLKSAVAELEPQFDSGNRPIIILASDLRKPTIEAASLEQRRQVRSLITSSPASPTVYLMPLVPLSDNTQTQSNVAVHIEPSSDSIVGTEQASQLDFTIGNFGDQPVDGAVIDIRLNGKTQATTRIDLAAGQIERRSILVPPLDAGDYVIEVNCDRQDNFALDNKGFWTLQSIESEPVLLIHGDHQDSSSVYFQFAISPPLFNEENEAGQNVMLPRQYKIVGPYNANNQNEIRKALSSGVEHVVLNNVQRVDDNLLNQIIESTKNGSIVFTAGKDLDRDWFKRFQEKHVNDFPIRFANTPRSSNVNDLLTFKSSAKTSFGNRLLESFANLEKSFELKSYWPIELTTFSTDSQSSPQNATSDSTEVDSMVDVLATNNNNQPIVVLCRNATGRTVLFSSCDFQPNETNLSLAPSFIPLVQSFYQQQLSNRFSNRNLQRGQELPSAVERLKSTPEKRSLELVNVKAWQYGFVVQSQEGQRQSIQSNSRQSELQRSTLPGAYSAIIEADQSSPIFATAQVAWQESDLTVVNRATAQKFAEEIGAQLFELNSTDQPQPESALSSNQTFWHVWRIVLLCLLFALFAELFLQRHLARSFAA